MQKGGRMLRPLHKFLFGLFFVQCFTTIFVTNLEKKMDSSRFLRAIVWGFALLFSFFSLPAQSVKYIDALKYYQQGEVEEARKLFQEEFQQNPSNDAACYYLAALSAADPKRIGEAETWFKKAVELSPDNFWYQYALAMFYLRTERQ